MAHVGKSVGHPADNAIKNPCYRLSEIEHYCLAQASPYIGEKKMTYFII